MPNRRIITVTIESMTADGAGLSHYTDKSIQVMDRPVKVWGAFTGETVQVEIYTKKGGIWYGVLSEVLQTSLVRVSPQDDVYLSSSPWQGISPDDELKFKLDIAQSVFRDTPVSKLFLDNMSPDDIFDIKENRHGYRNKMEYHLYEDDGEFGAKGDTVVTIFGRKEQRRIPIKTNSLAVPGLHEFVINFISDLQQNLALSRGLKTIIVRVIGDTARAALFVKDLELAERIGSLLQNESEFSKKYKDSITVYYSNPDSPASVMDRFIFEPQNPEIQANLLGVPLCFGIMSFFQVNTPMAEKLLGYLYEKLIPIIIELGDTKQNIQILDYYSGVGTIGLTLLSLVKKDSRIPKTIFEKISLILVEENKEAAKYAQKNIESLDLQNQVKNICGDSADFTELIQGVDILIVDPPRSGLHPRLRGFLESHGPEYLVYQSCNIESQARDIARIQTEYNILSFELFNFFPGTPHVESLAIFKKIQTAI